MLKDHRFVSAAIITLGFICSTALVGNTLIRIKGDVRDYTLQVTGAAKRRVHADRMTWNAVFWVQRPMQKEAYAELDVASKALFEVVHGTGVPTADVRMSSPEASDVETGPYAKRVVIGHRVQRTITISSMALDAVEKRDAAVPKLLIASQLSNDGAGFRASGARAIFSNLDALKHEAIAEATVRGRDRAQAVAGTAGITLGKLRRIELGDIELRTPGSSTRYSDDEPGRDNDIVTSVTLMYDLR